MFSFNPFPLLVTTRLQLRRLSTADAPEIFALRSDPVVNKYLDRMAARSIEDANEFIKKINFAIDAGQSIYWAIGFEGRPELIGTICLWNFSKEGSKAEIGYELLPQYHGKGIMQEALSRVTEYGFEILGLQKIEAWTVDQNVYSVRILERNFFKRDLDAETKLDRETEGKERIIYSLLKPSGFNN